MLLSSPGLTLLCSVETSRRFTKCLLWIVSVNFLAADHAGGAAMAFVDIEVDLQIASTTPGSTLSFVGSGTKQVGAITPAVTDSFNRIRIGGVEPASGVSVPMATGQHFELDAQARVESATLSLGESAILEVLLESVLEIHNSGTSDATVTFSFEREHRLRSPITAPELEFARARKIFSLSASSIDVRGAAADDFSHGFFMQVQQGQESILPEDNFNFQLLIPVGGSGRVAMSALARSHVAVAPTPEPSSATLCCWCVASLASVTRFARRAPFVKDSTSTWRPSTIRPSSERP